MKIKQPRKVKYIWWRKIVFQQRRNVDFKVPFEKGKTEKTYFLKKFNQNYEFSLKIKNNFTVRTLKQKNYEIIKSDKSIICLFYYVHQKKSRILSEKEFLNTVVEAAEN